MDHRHHKFFIGATALLILIIGLSLGMFLTAKTRFVDLEVITLGLLLTTTILLLIVGGIVLEIKESLIKKVKKR